ncbi:Spc98 protein [Martiniozyma asiatica (nom. inval.)]|nr:Spc98 protein [Martiniozyma asiatica]
MSTADWLTGVQSLLSVSFDKYTATKIISDAQRLLHISSKIKFQDETASFCRRLHEGFYGERLDSNVCFDMGNLITQQYMLTNHQQHNHQQLDSLGLSSSGLPSSPHLMSSRPQSAIYSPQDLTFQDEFELDICEELKYVLLGSSSNSFTFVNSKGKSNNNNSNSNAGWSIELNFNVDLLLFNHVGILYQLLELSILFKSLKVDCGQPRPSSVFTSFNAFIKRCLNNYSNDLVKIYQNKISFIKLKGSLMEWMIKLKFLNWLIMQRENLNPNEFLNKVESYSAHNGDLLIKNFAIQIFKEILDPYLILIRNWILAGDLNTEDSQVENFFIEKASKNVEYSLSTHKVPNFVKKCEYIFQIGKSILFFKNYFQDYTWCKEFSEQNFNVNPFNIDEVEKLYSIVIGRLNSKILNSYRVQVQQLNSFLLLRQGDFIESIIIKGLNLLSKPAASLSSHNLIKLLQDSIETTTVIENYPTDVYNRLDARLLRIDARGSIGWNIFTLDYNLPKEIAYIIGTEYKEYLRFFNFAIQIKRVQYELSESWLSSSRLNLNIKTKKRQSNFGRKLQSLFLKFNILRHQFLAFMHTIDQYISNEIIDRQFKEFENSFVSPSYEINHGVLKSLKNREMPLYTIDYLQKMHKRYIHSISRCELFSNGEYPTAMLLKDVIDTIDVFCKMSKQFELIVQSIGDSADTDADLSIFDNNDDDEMQTFATRKLGGLFYQLNKRVVESFESQLKVFVSSLKIQGGRLHMLGVLLEV